MSKWTPTLRLTPLALTLGALLCAGTQCRNSHGGGGAETPCPRAIPLVKANLVTRLGTSAEAVAVVAVEAVTWPDGCLGVPQPELCSPSPVAGCRVVLSALGTHHEYHTDADEGFVYAGPVP